MLEYHRQKAAAAKDWPHKPETQRQINLMPDVWRIASQLEMQARLQGFNMDLLYPKADIDWIKRLHVVANKRVHLTNLALLTISELPAGSLDDCEEVLTDSGPSLTAPHSREFHSTITHHRPTILSDRHLTE